MFLNQHVPNIDFLCQPMTGANNTATSKLSTGTYAFNTGCYGLLIMLAEFQKITFKTHSTFAFIDDILIVTKRTKQQHMMKQEEVMKGLDEAGVRLKLEKCRIAQKNTQRLGYQLTESGEKPVEKIQAITYRIRPKNLKELKSFMGALKQMNRIIPNLAKLCASLRPLLSRTYEWKWMRRKNEHFR